MNRTELYDDLIGLLAQYEYPGEVDAKENFVDASDLYRMLNKIHTHWNIITEKV